MSHRRRLRAFHGPGEAFVNHPRHRRLLRLRARCRRRLLRRIREPLPEDALLPRLLQYAAKLVNRLLQPRDCCLAVPRPLEALVIEGKKSTLATRLLQLSASAQAALAAGGAAGDADAAAAERQMVELLCGELARLAKMASIKPWAAQSCADSPRWPAAFTDAAVKTFGKKKYVKLSNVLPPRLLRFMQGWYRYLSDEDGGGVAVLV